ncbi:FH5, partial [Symbiodinium microadriaticum]
MDDVPENRRIGLDGQEGKASRNPPVGSLLLADVVQVLDYSSIASKLNFQLQNCFTLVVKESTAGVLKHYHMYAETLRIKHMWMIAIHARLNQIALSRAAYRFPMDSLRHTSSAAVKLRKTFEQHVAIYRSVTKEDIALMYNTVVADALHESDLTKVAAIDPIDITRFINYELQNHKYERKLQSALKDLASFVTERYAPKPEIIEEDEAERGKKYPLAVPDSERVIPKAPPLPYVPAAKPPKRPRAKVRQLFWTKVKPINVVNTVWMALEEPEFSWDEVDKRFAVTDTILNLMVPTAEEVTTIRAYEDDVSNLDFCGRLFTYFLGIERLEQRLQVHRVMLSWFEFANSINNYIITIAQAVEELNDAECLQGLKIILSSILSLGNYMNGSTTRGQAHGYRMDVILKLKDVRQAAGYGRRNMLHFIVEQMPMIFPEIEPFYTSWKAMWTSVSVHYQDLEEMMKDLKSDLEKCAAEIEMAELIEDEAVRTQLIEKLSSFITMASDTYTELCNYFDRTDAAVRAAKRYFGETVLGCSPQNGTEVVLSGAQEDPWSSFFILIVKFAQMYKTATVELVEWEKQEERIRQQAIENSKRKVAHGIKLKRVAEEEKVL